MTATSVVLQLWLGAPKFIIGHVTIIMPIWGTAGHPVANVGNQCAKFEVFSFTHSKNILED